MPIQLNQLELLEISLVPQGDDPLAKVAITKRKDPESEKGTVKEMSEEMKAKLKPYVDKGMSEEDALKAYHEEMEKSVETFKAENERLRKALIENEFVIKADTIEKKATEETIEVEGEMVAKSAIPAPVLKALEAADVAKRDAVVTEKAKTTLPNFNQDVAKSFMGLNLSDEMLEALKAADALFAGMTEEVGKSDVDGNMSDPQAQLDALVEKTATEQKINKYAAYAEVAKTKIGKDLINKASYKKED